MAGTAAAIRLTTSLLLRLLRIRLAGSSETSTINADQIQAIAPTAVDDESPVRLILYLYSVTKSGALNTDSTRYSGATREKAPLGVELRYLLMAFPSQKAENKTEGTLLQHELLGAAMQTLYDTETISADELPGDYQDEGLTITLESSDPLETAELWGSVAERPLHPCVTYVVRPVHIPSTQSTPLSDVTDRDLSVSRGVDDGREDSESAGRLEMGR